MVRRTGHRNSFNDSVREMRLPWKQNVYCSNVGHLLFLLFNNLMTVDKDHKTNEMLLHVR